MFQIDKWRNYLNNFPVRKPPMVPMLKWHNKSLTLIMCANYRLLWQRSINQYERGYRNPYQNDTIYCEKGQTNSNTSFCSTWWKLSRYYENGCDGNNVNRISKLVILLWISMNIFLICFERFWGTWNHRWNM